ncbi:MAG: Rid family detoxifying hydrolase [Pseudomonadota bacterium]
MTLSNQTLAIVLLCTLGVMSPRWLKAATDSAEAASAETRAAPVAGAEVRRAKAPGQREDQVQTPAVESGLTTVKGSPPPATAPPSARSRVRFLNSGEVLPSNLPFSEAVEVGGTIYLSGQIGVIPGSLELIEGGITEQAQRTLDNIDLILKAHGYARADVVKCLVMLADIDEWGAFNSVYTQFFEPPYPARSALAASGLALGARVEVECIAAR